MAPLEVAEEKIKALQEENERLRAVKYPNEIVAQQDRLIGSLTNRNHILEQENSDSKRLAEERRFQPRVFIYNLLPRQYLANENLRILFHVILILANPLFSKGNGDRSPDAEPLDPSHAKT